MEEVAEMECIVNRKIVLLGLLTIASTLNCGALDTLILRPSALLRRLPTDFGYAYETKTVPSPTGQMISLWHVSSSVERKGIIVTVPGNDANKSRYVVSLPLFADDGWDLILVDYTGFGESPGEATLQGLFDSTYGAIDYALTQSDVVVGYGISLGTGVLARVAADRPLTACIFESTMVLREAASLFTRYHGVYLPIVEVANLVATFGSPPEFDTKHWITKIHCPKLFLHSPDDGVTPYEGAWEVFKLAPQPKHLFVTQGNHAMQVFLDPALYRSVVNGWLDGILNHRPIVNLQFDAFLEEEIRVTFEALGLPPPEPGTFGR